MIAKGTAVANGVALARYLITGKDGERAELIELRGFASVGIEDAFRSVHVMAKGTKCQNPFFHLYVRNRVGEILSRDQWQYTAKRIERILGLSDQPRAIAFHIDRNTGEQHMHVAWSRIIHESLTAKPLPYYKTRLKQISRELERCFGLAPVPNERKSSIRYAPTRAEEQQARRLGFDIHDVRETIRACFERCDCGRSFQSALENEGMTLSRGDRRDFLVICSGGTYSLGKRLLGISAARIRERLADLSPEDLPSVDDARNLIARQQRKNELPSIMQLAPEPRPNIEPCAPVKSQADSEIELPNCAARLDVRAQQQQMPVPPATRVDVVPEPPFERTPSRRSQLCEVLKRQFRAVVRALTHPAPRPVPKRRRRREEAVGAFRLAAWKILRPITRLPAISQATAFVQDTLTWLHLWAWNDNADKNPGLEESGSREEKNQLFPHP